MSNPEDVRLAGSDTIATHELYPGYGNDSSEIRRASDLITYQPLPLAYPAMF
jgi:hypothetical protein